jgi:hypothetical protein
MWTFLLTAGVVIFSLFAAGCWLSSATGRTLEWRPWRQSVIVVESEHSQEIMAISSHRSLKEVEHYTAAVRRSRLANSGMAKLK